MKVLKHVFSLYTFSSDNTWNSNRYERLKKIILLLKKRYVSTFPIGVFRVPKYLHPKVLLLCGYRKTQETVLSCIIIFMTTTYPFMILSVNYFLQTFTFPHFSQFSSRNDLWSREICMSHTFPRLLFLFCVRKYLLSNLLRFITYKIDFMNAYQFHHMYVSLKNTISTSHAYKMKKLYCWFDIDMHKIEQSTYIFG